MVSDDIFIVGIGACGCLQYGLVPITVEKRLSSLNLLVEMLISFRNTLRYPEILFYHLSEYPLVLSV